MRQKMIPRFPYINFPFSYYRGPKNFNPNQNGYPSSINYSKPGFPQKSHEYLSNSTTDSKTSNVEICNQSAEDKQNKKNKNQIRLLENS